MTVSMGRRARPRYVRLAAAVAALLVTLVTLLAGIGVLPFAAGSAAASQRSAPSPSEQAALTGTTTAEADLTSALPDRSGTGRRVVFDLSDQRVWLVEGNEDVARTYLVSGSLTDNLSPGTYQVFSRSRWATGIDDSGEMEYFVRFTRGANAAIGFHSIPTKDGQVLQTRAQLGTPQSHGCIRQALPDAKKLWAFAPVGTKVVVTA